uniref:Palmitoyltransferase PFA4 n=1 Tax=Kwoniella dejecticola CBS 10117 TaxID=1296121 RepID=A0A1A6A6Q9_9TREE|nr:palmitoyltransferase PFA4 [Kwoniella dejecticola CBS 10117]OBR85745.1 palmitoyltransferase PFA4 [Kwoniella dejecticola CBS 10117]
MARDWGTVCLARIEHAEKSMFDVHRVIGTSLLISFISFSSQIFVVWPWYGREVSVDLLKLLLPFNFCVFMVFWNYRLCVITPPGGVPTGYRPNLNAVEGLEVKKGNHAPRYCKTCEHFKPPRAHHCRQCRTCIVNHCPWIANCVGFHNQGHFLRFLLWVDIATSYHLVMIVKRVLFISYKQYEEPTLNDVLFIVFNFAACVPVWLCVGMFSMYHLYLACGNSTTIEGWEKDKVATLVRRGKIKEIKYPYNIGLYKNVKSVLGSNPLLWLWPQPMRGDGLSFPVNPDAGSESTASVQWANIVAPRRDRDGPPPFPLPPTIPTMYGSADERREATFEQKSERERYGINNPDAQYLWPPKDPGRLPDPRPIPSGTSPFIYGNEGFNPNLRPSNSQIRARSQYSTTPQDVDKDEEQAYSSGEDRDYGSISEGSSRSRSSSPEIYLSDYDEHNEGPLGGQRMPRMRRGSEGWEVRPAAGSWAGHMRDIEGADDGPSYSSRRPWEEEGRYNYYIPDE